MDWGSEIIVIPALFIGLPWIILHYMTRWKTAATITEDDEVLLDELYSLAKRLDERMDTVERLVSTSDPSFEVSSIQSNPRLALEQEADNAKLRELDRMLAEKKGMQR